MLPTKFRIIWQRGLRGEIFRNRQIRNKSCLWRPCLLMDREETSAVHRGSSIDASCQVLIHLAEGFQRRRLKCEKLTTTDAKWWQKLTLPLAMWPKKGINLLSTSIFKDDSMKIHKNRVQTADRAPVRIRNKILLLVSDICITKKELCY